jgi:hypothetical protein
VTERIAVALVAGLVGIVLIVGLCEDWTGAHAMVGGMLAEPWHLIGYEENRLREFLDLLQVAQRDCGSVIIDRIAA